MPDSRSSPSPSEPRFTLRLDLALSLARQWHAGQTRKGTEIPYVGHLMHVSAFVIEAGGTEEQAIAGLLHDALEDAAGIASYEERRDRIATEFGAEVLQLVEGCTDGSPRERQEMPWRERKERYLAHLEKAPERLLVVSLADKLHNATAILRDLRRRGPVLLHRFHGDVAGTLWYYRSLADVFTSRLDADTRPGRMALELERVVGAMETEAAGET